MNYVITLIHCILQRISLPSIPLSSRSFFPLFHVHYSSPCKQQSNNALLCSVLFSFLTLSIPFLVSFSFFVLCPFCLRSVCYPDYFTLFLVIFPIDPPLCAMYVRHLDREDLKCHFTQKKFNAL